MTTRTTNTSAEFGLRRVLHDFFARWAARSRERALRRRMRDMAELDDNILDDIGVTRGEIYRATSFPLSVDAAMELRRTSLERRRSGF